MVTATSSRSGELAAITPASVAAPVSLGPAGSLFSVVINFLAIGNKVETPPAGTTPLLFAGRQVALSPHSRTEDSSSQSGPVINAGRLTIPRFIADDGAAGKSSTIG